MLKTPLAVTVITATGLVLVAGCSGTTSTSPSQSASTSASATDSHGEHPAWSYSGATGPDNWASLSPEYASCGTGKQQSPINVSNPTTSAKANPTLTYAATTGSVVDTGHSINLISFAGNSLNLAGTKFMLTQTHFHAPSENTLNGVSFPVEFHFVHENAKKQLAVLSVFVTPGATNSAWQPFIDQVSVGTGDDDAHPITINWASLVPPLKSTVQFAGSLTTPPCTEGVSWIVDPNPISMSPAQIAALTASYDHNSRPVQPLNGRAITQDAP
ncbi:MAG: carbonic anhydrase family protein [Actinomycetes bacterium]